MENQNFYQSTGQHYMYRTCLQVPQTWARNGITIHTPAYHQSCSTTSLYGKQNSFQTERLSMASCALHLEDAYILFVLAKEMFKYQSHAADTVSIPEGRWLGFLSIYPIRQGSHTRVQKGRHFQGSLRVNHPKRKGRDMHAAVESAPHKHLEEDCREHHRSRKVAS